MNLQPNHIAEYLTGLALTYGLNILGAIITLIAGYLLAGWATRLTTHWMSKAEHIDKVFHTLPGRVVRVAILALTLIAVLNRFGVQTTSLIAVLGAAGLAIGLALQGTLSNVAAGVMLLVFRPFKIGDAVKVDGDVYVIDNVGFFICKAHLPDGPIAFVPNSKIWGQTIVNLSVTDNDRRRIDELYGIGYGDDIGAALEILRGVVAAEPRVLADPAPLIKVESLGDSSVNLLFRVWTARADWWDTKLDLLRQCKEALDKGGINIPFPQRDVHLIAPPVAESR
jgi:small conductance mechanosensitive channel